MALPATIYRARIELADTDRHRYQSLHCTVARHPSETAERLIGRVLAYALYYEPELAFTRGICAGAEPDLWVREADGRVRLWLEVGLPEPERLLKASRHAGRVVLVALGGGRPRWQAQHLARLAAVGNLEVIGFDQAFIGRLVAGLERVIDWSLTVTEGTLYLSAGGETLETVPERLAG